MSSVRHDSSSGLALDGPAAEPKRIVVCHTLNSFITGGIERLLEISLIPMRNRGIDSVVVGWRNDHPNIRQLTDLGVPYYQIADTEWRYRYSLKLDDSIRNRMQEVVERHGVQVLHGHHRWDPAVTHDLAKAVGLPYVLTLHNMSEPWETEPGFLSTMWRLRQMRAYRGASMVNCVSKAVLDHLREGLQVRVQDARVLEICCSDETWEGGQADAVRDIDVVLAGRLAAQKNVLFAMSALAEVRKSIPNLRVALVGDGPDRDEVLAKIEGLGLTDCVEFLGHRSQQEVRDIENRSKVFYAPSHFEGLSQSAVEALGLGLYAVMSTAPSFTKVFPGEAGAWFCDPHDLEANRSALVEAIQTYSFVPRPHLRDRFSVGRFAQEMSEMYAGVVSNN